MGLTMDSVMHSPQAMVMALRRHTVWILGILVLATAVFAGSMYEQRRNDAALSAQFRGSAQQAYRAINTCETYKFKHRDAYDLRELDAEKAVAAANALARTHADRLAAMALSDYLHELKAVRLAWQNRDRKSGKRNYAESTRELRAAKQKVHTSISTS
jgi:hypothetical protein